MGAFFLAKWDETLMFTDFKAYQGVAGVGVTERRSIRKHENRRNDSSKIF